MKSYKDEINQLINQLDSEINILSNRCTNLALGDYDLDGLYSEVFMIYNKSKDLMEIIRNIRSIINPPSLEPINMTSGSST